MQFSTMITELSTINPKSIAPRLIRLALMPETAIMLVANSIDRGIARATISPARTLPKQEKQHENHQEPALEQIRQDRVQRARDQVGHRS